jgi:acyl dehydratase
MPAKVFGPVVRQNLVRYAGASGDFNPIHFDEPFASDAGLPSVLGTGMLPAGILGACLAGWLGPENVRSLAIRFTGRYWPGDELTFRGAAVSVEPLDAGEGRGVAVVEAEVVSQKGEKILTARALAEVRTPALEAVGARPEVPY